MGLTGQCLNERTTNAGYETIPSTGVLDHLRFIERWAQRSCMCVFSAQTTTHTSLLTLANQPDDFERIGFSEYHAVGSESAAYMLTSQGFKYHHYVGHPPELFCLESDPEELFNLANDITYAHVLERMEKLLRDMLDPVAIDHLAKRDQNNLIAKFGGREKALASGNAGPTPMHEKYRML